MTPHNATLPSQPRSIASEAMIRATIQFCLLYTLVALVGALFDNRLVNGERAWFKPFKFGVSIVVYLATVLWALRSLSAPWRQGKSASLFAATLGLCTIFELAWIGLQAARGQASHFNVSTPFYARMYSAMAFAAVALVLAGGGFGLLVMLDRTANLSRPLRTAVVYAFPASALLTLLTALTMGSRLSHFAGLESPSALHLPFTGWSLTVGDMRVPHFLANHLMQAAPAFAWLASKIASDRLASLAAASFTVLWTALTLWVFRTVLTGKPFFALLA
jgi:hypothetical protein